MCACLSPKAVVTGWSPDGGKVPIQPKLTAFGLIVVCIGAYIFVRRVMLP